MRPTLFRYLRLAHERHIACVKSEGDHFWINAAADTLKDKLGLQSVQVVPDGGLRRIDPRGGAAAAQFLPDFVGSVISLACLAGKRFDMSRKACRGGHCRNC